MLHLQQLSLHGPVTGMTAKNLAIVWAPNLLRPRQDQCSTAQLALQTACVEVLIGHADVVFATDNDLNGPREIDIDTAIRIRKHEGSMNFNLT